MIEGHGGVQLDRFGNHPRGADRIAQLPGHQAAQVPEIGIVRVHVVQAAIGLLRLHQLALAMEGDGLAEAALVKQGCALQISDARFQMSE